MGGKGSLRIGVALKLRPECQVWYHMPVIPEFERLRQEDFSKFKVSLVYSELKANLKYIDITMYNVIVLNLESVIGSFTSPHIPSRCYMKPTLAPASPLTPPRPLSR